MVTLPKNIDEWTIGTITDILHSGQYETDVIEFKEDIMSENERIARTCCAFTNTNGGIMIFGISDDRSKPSLQRITGLNRTEDNVTKITSQIKNITPQIELQNIVFSKYPILISDTKEIILLEIKPSYTIHQFENKFYKRLHGRNDPMPYTEIEMKFLESRKNAMALGLMLNEGGLLRDESGYITNTATDGTYEDLMTYCGDMKAMMFNSFLFNQAYLYDDIIQTATLRVVETVNKLNSVPEIRKLFSSPTPEFLKENKVTSGEDYIRKQVLRYTEELLNGLKTIEDNLHLKMPEPILMYDITKPEK